MSKRPQPTIEQKAALMQIFYQEGRLWKSKLRHAWETGIYPPGCDSANLQQVRNTLGPTWLANLHASRMEISIAENAVMQDFLAHVLLLTKAGVMNPLPAESVRRLAFMQLLRNREEQLEHVNTLRAGRGEPPIEFNW